MVFKIGDGSLPFTARELPAVVLAANFYFHATTAYDILR